jgi:hypothetical protein
MNIRSARGFKTRRALPLAALLLLLVPYGARTGEACTVSEISAKEAESIVLSIPWAIEAEPTFAYLIPSKESSRFYSFELRTGNERASGQTIMRNGLLGHFAVNKRTGDVWSEDADDWHVTGPALSKIQEQIRRAHCISKDLVESEGMRGPFDD